VSLVQCLLAIEDWNEPPQHGFADMTDDRPNDTPRPEKKIVALPFPKTGRLAGIDFGTVRIGISICDPMWILVSPLEIRNVSNEKTDGFFFRDLVSREVIEGFVVGLPIHCDGGESDKSRQARKFACWLGELTNVPVRLFDERFTTSAAQMRMRSATGAGKKTRHRLVDAIAAQVLLESFLEATRYREELPGHSPWEPATGDASIE
jgi:putative Holliday junction resolvase